MTQATMSTDLLQALQIVTELGVDTVSENLAVLAIDDIALTIEEPGWDFVLRGVLDNRNNPLQFFRGKFASAIRRRLVLAPITCSLDICLTAC